MLPCSIQHFANLQVGATALVAARERKQIVILDIDAHCGSGTHAYLRVMGLSDSSDSSDDYANKPGYSLEDTLSNHLANILAGE